MWMTKFGTNGRYIASPTTDGKIFIWNIRSKELVTVLRDHRKDSNSFLTLRYDTSRHKIPPKQTGNDSMWRRFSFVN